MMKKALSLLLTVSILLSTFAGLGMGAYAATPSSGQCGDNVSYTFNSTTGELVISGSGAMRRYSCYYLGDIFLGANTPFYRNSAIKKVEIKSGVTSIGSNAFYECRSLTSIIIPNSMTSIEANAFYNCSGLTSIMIPNSVTNIGGSAFYGCDSLTSVCYIGTMEQWNSITIGSKNDSLITAQRYYPLTTKLILKHSARTANTIKVSWNMVNTATGYQVQVSTKDGKKWSTYATLKAGTSAYTFKKLAAGNNYKFRVRFYIKAADGKNYFSPWSKTLNSPTLPAATQFTKVKPTSKTQLQLNWKKVSGVTGYQVQISLDKAFKKSAKLYTYKGSATTSKKIGGLRSNTQYFLRVRTYKTISGKTYYAAWSKVAGGKMPK